jgi:hypothetical protein
MSLKIKAKLNYFNVENPPAGYVLLELTEANLDLYRKARAYLNCLDKDCTDVYADMGVTYADFILGTMRIDVDAVETKLREKGIRVNADGGVKYWMQFEDGGWSYEDVVHLNDCGVPFPEIADLIEEVL